MKTKIQLLPKRVTRDGELHETIARKIVEARRKAEWHEDHNYREEAVYFRGWAFGLADLQEAVRGRKARASNG